KRRLRSCLDRLAASCKDLALAAWRLYPTMLRPCAAPVAQLDRALPSEGRGREFESRRVRHLKALKIKDISVWATAPTRNESGPKWTEQVTNPPKNGGKVVGNVRALFAR